MKNHFTIIIPSYNCEQWVEWNLRSALQQDYENYEIVYVDDCSTDNTLNVATKILSESNKNYRIISNDKNMKALYNLYTQIDISKNVGSDIGVVFLSQNNVNTGAI